MQCNMLRGEMHGAKLGESPMKQRSGTAVWQMLREATPSSAARRGEERVCKCRGRAYELAGVAVQECMAALCMQCEVRMQRGSARRGKVPVQRWIGGGGAAASLRSLPQGHREVREGTELQGGRRAQAEQAAGAIVPPRMMQR